ncbi:MAG: helix-turn-helix transcriptional regulator [Gluconacetobacter diazotrophicus]|nr:helix-turn-helix transcriptional regulator [Gluconacetobacter diazotrophicus]
MTHEEFWRALDTLAAERGLSSSGLARAAGLDPTTFNRSKRVARDGTPRWPGTDTLARVLSAAGIGLGEFAVLVGGARVLRSAGRRAADRLRAVPFSLLPDPALFDDAGHPVPAAPGWTAIDLPFPAAPDSYAVILDTDALEPDWRRDAVLLVVPSPRPLPGDRALRWQPDERPPVTLVRVPPRDERPAERLHRVLWVSF